MGAPGIDGTAGDAGASGVPGGEGGFGASGERGGTGGVGSSGVQGGVGGVGTLGGHGGVGAHHWIGGQDVPIKHWVCVIPIEMWVWILAQPIPWLLARHAVDREVSTSNAVISEILRRFDIIEILSWGTDNTSPLQNKTLCQVCSWNHCLGAQCLLRGCPPRTDLLSLILFTVTQACTRKPCFQLQE